MKKKTTVKKIAKWSNNAVATIRTIAQNLALVNETIELSQAENQKSIETLQAANMDLDALKTHNKKVISNIEGLLSC